ncbi:electron transport complex protein RnfA [Ulvibacterium marinum]|uniref:Ion-translocating oxidoreductase complex subunit A n=1 Tax=Ulvibacterium marinum TaxID=2419782 RepID=A0A3B0CEG7_9FLAO|nr:RnfABCDGE type electron transport complex subunit A [Ulvibacterium marinum]RKN83238.1 RnfABCDGE type electron transport complex subunit A [Ulvibacterium marinum]
MDYLVILIAAVFVNNIVLSQFLGICPFLGVSNRISTSVGMSGAVLFVMTIATTVTYLLHQYILIPSGLDYLRTITFILVIAALVQMVEIILKKVSPPLYQALGVFLPLITTNCAVLGVAILALGLENGSLLKAVFFALSHAIGFSLALVVFASIREFLELADLPEGMKGVPINLLVAGLLSLAFLGFAGLV